MRCPKCDYDNTIVEAEDLAKGEIECYMCKTAFAPRTVEGIENAMQRLGNPYNDRMGAIEELEARVEALSTIIVQLLVDKFNVKVQREFDLPAPEEV